MLDREKFDDVTKGANDFKHDNFRLFGCNIISALVRTWFANGSDSSQKCNSDIRKSIGGVMPKCNIR